MSMSVFPGERPDRMEEECGVFGIYAPGEDVARMTCFGLQALQHRGQESAGIAVGDGATIMASKDLGLVTFCVEGRFGYWSCSLRHERRCRFVGSGTAPYLGNR